MFSQAFPERDPLRRRLLITEPDRRYGGLSRRKSGEGVIEWECVPEGLACTYREGTTTMGMKQTEMRTSFWLAKMITATYDRNSSALVSFDASLLTMAVVAGIMKIDTALERTNSILDTSHEHQDIRMLVDFMCRKPTVFFYSVNAKDEVVEVSLAEALADVGEGGPPNIVHQQWVGETPLFGLPMAVVIEQSGISLVVRGTSRSYWFPVAGFFKDTITTDLSGDELKAYIQSVFPAVSSIDHDQPKG